MITKRFAPLSFLAAAVASMAGRFRGFLPTMSAAAKVPVYTATTARALEPLPEDVRAKLAAAAMLRAELKRARKATARGASNYARTNPQFLATLNPIADSPCTL